MRRVKVLFLVALILFSATSLHARAASNSGCQRCVTGGDGNAYCKPLDTYLTAWQPVADCEPIIQCYYMPGAGLWCFPDCAGSPCYFA